MRHAFLILSLSLGVLGRMSAAEQPNAAEAKLREGLKNTMLQLRTTQAEKATLEATKVELEAKLAELSEKADKLEKQSIDDKAAADKRVAEQMERLVEKGNYVVKLETDLTAIQKAYKDSAALAAKKEAERAKLQSDKVVLERKVTDQQAKNLEMYKLGTEILIRYEKFGLGTAITAREPFVGLTRIKLQNLIQDYGDKLADQKIKP